jgi:hypothetical protein
MNTIRRLSLWLGIVLVFTVSGMPAAAQPANLVYWPTNDWQSSTPEEQGMDSTIPFYLDLTGTKIVPL